MTGICPAEINWTSIFYSLTDFLWFHELIYLSLLNRKIHDFLVNKVQVKNVALHPLYLGLQRFKDHGTRKVAETVLKRSFNSIITITDQRLPIRLSHDFLLAEEDIQVCVMDVLVFLKSCPSLENLVLSNSLRDSMDGIFKGMYHISEDADTDPLDSCILKTIVAGQCSLRYCRDLGNLIRRRIYQNRSELVDIRLSSALWRSVGKDMARLNHTRSESIFETDVDAWLNLKSLMTALKYLWKPNTHTEIFIQSITGLQPLIAAYGLQVFSHEFDTVFPYKLGFRISIGAVHVQLSTTSDVHSVDLLLQMIKQNAPQLLRTVCFCDHSSSRSRCQKNVHPWQLDWRPNQLENDLEHCVEEVLGFISHFYNLRCDAFFGWSRNWISLLFKQIFQEESLRLSLESALNIVSKTRCVRNHQLQNLPI